MATAIHTNDTTIKHQRKQSARNGGGPFWQRALILPLPNNTVTLPSVEFDFDADMAHERRAMARAAANKPRLFRQAGKPRLVRQCSMELLRKRTLLQKLLGRRAGPCPHGNKTDSESSIEVDSDTARTLRSSYQSQPAPPIRPTTISFGSEDQILIVPSWKKQKHLWWSPDELEESYATQIVQATHDEPAQHYLVNYQEAHEQWTTTELRLRRDDDEEYIAKKLRLPAAAAAVEQGLAGGLGGLESFHGELETSRRERGREIVRFMVDLSAEETPEEIGAQCEQLAAPAKRWARAVGQACERVARQEER